jgi:hypothetical protein
MEEVDTNNSKNSPIPKNLEGPDSIAFVFVRMYEQADAESFVLEEAMRLLEGSQTEELPLSRYTVLLFCD